jgi:hypothetical protein
MSRSISGIFLGVKCKKRILCKFIESLFALNHLFKHSNSIFVSFLKSSKLDLINITLVSTANKTGLDFSLIDLTERLCVE